MSKISGDGNLQGVPCIDNDVNNSIDNSIHTIYNTFNRPTTQESQERERSSEMQHLLNWLSEQNFAITQNDIFNQRADGTGIWLLEDPIFLEWFNGKSKVLCCYGIPGAGKSVLASVVINHLEKTFADDKTTAITYIYCNYKEQSQQTMESLIRNLLRQLLIVAVQGGLNKEYNAVLALYKEHKEKSRSLARVECLRILKDAILAFTKVFIIVDAVDEMIERERERFLRKLESFTELKSIFVLVMSRPIPEIKDYFGSSVQLEISAKESDLAAYVDGQLLSRNVLTKQVKKNPTLSKEIKKGIIDKALGMFLLATFHLEAVATASTLKELRQHLQNLPEGIDDTYNYAIHRIRGSEWEDLARRVLTWIIYALRPLSITELQHALATEEKIIDLEEDSLIFEDRILSVCGGLVILEDKSRIIKLVHYTAQDYFRRNGLQLPGPIPNAMITTTCIMYLSQGHTIFEGFLSDETQYNFLRYAAQNWSHHAREALDQLQAERPATELTNLEQQIVTFLRQHEVRESSATSRFWARNMEFWAETESSVEWDTPPLLVAIKFGLDKIVRILLQEVRLLNLCNWWRSAVFYAAAGGFEGILEMLVEAGVDLKAVGDTALSGAIKGRNEGIVRLLLDKGVKTGYDRGGEPPLWIAVEKGHEGIVRLLLDKGAKTEYDGERKPPLLIAAENGYEGIVRLLLDGGAKTEYGNMWKSPLWIAAKEGHEGIVRLLLDNFAKTNYDDMWESPLCIAVEEGHEGIVRLLLGRGTKTEYGDMRKSPLWIAAKEGHEGIVRLLLDSGANTEYGGKREPPLCIAAENGHGGIVQLLLDKGADIGALGKKKSSYSLIYSNSTETSLWIAVMKGHERVVRLLLDRGAKIEHDKNRKSLILVAAAKGYEEILHLLFGTVANANVKHITAICKAAASGDEGALQLLFDQGVDPGAEIWAIHKSAKILTAVEKGHERIVRNNDAHTEVLGEGNNEEGMYNMYGGAPLWAAVVNGHGGIVRLLLDKGAYTEILGKGNNRGNKYKGTPLWVAAINGHEGMVRLLLDKGADIDVRGEGEYGGNTYEGTPLWVAAMNGHEGIVRLLLDKGADIEALEWGSNGGNMYGGTPLWVAVMNGRERIVRLLLDKGAYTGVLREINDEEDMCILYKGTPLWIAATEGHEGIVQLLLDLGVHTEALGEGGYDTYSKGTPLWVAAMNGHEGIVRLLLNKGAHTDALGRGYWDDDMYEGTPLLAAAMNGHEGIVRLLLDKGANIEGLGREDESSGQESEHAEDIIYKATPLWVAAMNGHEGIVQQLLDKGAHTEILREGSGNMYMVYEGTPLWVAATKGHEGIVRLLLNKGAYTEVLGKRNNGEDMHKGTPLWVAAMNGHEGIVQLLLDKGAHTEALGEARFRKHMFKVTSLWVAAKNGHEGVVRLLLDKGANIGAFGVQESIQPPFFQESILRHFFQESIQQSFFTQSGIRQEMIRLISIAIRDKGIVEFLYVKSAHTEGRVGQYLDEDMYKGTTPLCIAAMECREDIVQLMLDRGAVCCGKTLCAAAEVGNLRIVRMLLEGGDITVHGGMALCVAALLGRRRVLHLLLDRGASVNTRVPGRFYFESGFLAMTNSWTPLSCAIFMGHVELIDILLQHGAATDGLNYEELLLYTRLEYIRGAIRQLLSEKLATGEAGNVSNQKRGEVGRGPEAERIRGWTGVR